MSHGHRQDEAADGPGGPLQEPDRDKYRVLFEEMNEAVLLAEADTGMLVEANKEAERLFGRPRDEIIGMHQTEVHPLGKADEYRHHFANHAAKGRLADYDGEIIREDGTIIPVSISASAFTLGGQPLVLGLFRDITQRKQAEEALRRSEQDKAAVLDSMSELVVYQDPDMTVRWANRAACESVGVSPEQLIGRRCYEIWQGRQEPCVDCPVAKARQTGQPQDAEAKTPDGRIWLIRGYPLKDAHGSVEAVVEVAQDITARKRAEEALRAKTQEFEAIYKAYPDLQFRLAADGTILDYQVATESDLYLPPEEFLGRRMQDILPPDVARQLGEAVRQAHETGLLVSVEYTLPMPHGDRHYEARIVPLKDSEIVAIVRDITERRKVEEAVHASREQLTLALDAVSDGVWDLDWPTHTFQRSDHWYELIGYSQEELECWEAEHGSVVHPDDRAGLRAAAQRHARGETISYRAEFRIRHGSGKWRWLLGRGKIVERGPNGEPLRMIGTDTDITGRKRAQEALRQSEELLRRVIDADPNLIFVKDKSGRYVLVNEAQAKLYETTPSEMVGKTDADFAQEGSPLAGEADDFMTDDLDVIESGHAKVIPEESFTLSDGTTRWFQTTKVPLTLGGDTDCVLGVAVDITARKRGEDERRELESEVQHAQKLESLGVLAGGIAHDFNNLLAGILGNADLVLTALPDSTPARDSIEEIKKASVRAADLTRQMLAYSGKGQFVVEPVDLNELVDEMGHLLHASISKKATIAFDLADELPLIKADAAQIQQVVMNLITNASDAIAGAVGVITIRTGMVEADRALLSEAYADDDLPEGRYVCLRVADTGCGMDNATCARVFDPFFTTKFAGRGLGLAAVLGIVRGHGGAITVESERGRGTTFTVLFPCSERPIQAVPEPERPAGEWRGTGTVLVVDDEQLVRDVAARILEYSGFEVITAAEARKGVELFRELADEIAAVLLDMTMPEMSGEEAFRELRRIRPDVPVILTSGYNEQDAVSRFTEQGLAGFVHKPFDVETLVRTMRKALER